jgi:phage tail-like protein
MATTKTANQRKLAQPEAPRTAGSMSLLPVGTVPETSPSGVDEASAPAAALGDFSAAIASDLEDKIVTEIKEFVTDAVDALLGGSGTKQGKGMATPRLGDPDVGYAFKVSIGSVTYAMFSEVSGLSWKAESIPVRSGGNNEHGYHMRGPGKFEPLTLKRGWFASTGEFFDMMKSSLQGSSIISSLGGRRTNLTITVLDRKYQPIGEYRVFNAFITEYAGPSLNASSGQVAFEQIRMSYDYFEYNALV